MICPIEMVKNVRIQRRITGKLVYLKIVVREGTCLITNRRISTGSNFIQIAIAYSPKYLSVLNIVSVDSGEAGND